MKVTYRWIREFVATELSPVELGERLTMAGIEVEALTALGEKLGGLKVGRVASVRRHPQADRLTLCEVEDGRGVIPVVCGAPNVEAGAAVALAPVGAVLRDGTHIRKAKIRGEISEGMLLSEAELGISSDHDGILLLDGAPPVGTPLADALGLDDWLFELGLTPNRSDCLGVLGVAREIAALTGAPLVTPSTDLAEEGAPASDSIRVEIQDPERCSRYRARVIKGVRVARSPLWLRMRLAAVGVRSISNVVDASNLVLLEWGHPLHVFDLARISDGRIVVRAAREGETLVTLDGVERRLSPEDLVIADGSEPIALAGVMGGERSGVHDDTSDLVLESAHFSPSSIRRTARRAGLHTEASHRFERGTDPLGLATALERLARVIVELAGGTVARDVVEAYPRPHRPLAIRFRPERARSLLGVEVSDRECSDRLEALGIDVKPVGDHVEAIAPSWRPDLEREVDLIEEVARSWGYDRIPANETFAGSGAGGSGGRPTSAFADRIELARDLLVGQGLREIVKLAFTSASHIERFRFPDGRADPIRIRNPLGEEGAVLATALLPGLLEVARAHLNHHADGIRICQVARVHRRAGGKWPFRELETAAALVGGRSGIGPFPESVRPRDFHDLKGTLEILLEGLGIKGIAFRPADALHYWEGGQASEVWLGDRKVGEAGALSLSLLRELDVECGLYGFEIDLTSLGEPSPPRYLPFPRHPATFRDLAVEVGDASSAADVEATVRAGKWVEDVELFDLYQGEGLSEGRKSLAFHVRLRHPERTLTEQEAAVSLDRVVQALELAFEAKRR